MRTEAMVTVRRAIHKIEVERSRGRDYRHHEVEELCLLAAEIDEWLAGHGIADWRVA